jgi:gamma-glutamyltranspeptidase / glutathione hydrolase
MGMVTDSAMVVSAHPLATAVGVHILQRGGNAVDAAVAVHWALAVVAPWAGNIGGGGLMVVRSADGTVHTLDFREMAPLAAHRDMYLDEHGQPISKLSLVGHKAVGVPGSVAGLFTAHDSLGRLPMAELIQPAIELAQSGFTLTALEAKDTIGMHQAEPVHQQSAMAQG